MKSCPQCRRTYSDETLSFCLEDGALLSASYNPQETNAPTFVLNSFDVPPTQASEIPTVITERTEIPTVVNTPRPTQEMKTASVGWKIYLAGLIISIVADLIYTYLLYPFYGAATDDIFKKIMHEFDDPAIGISVAAFIVVVPINLVYFALVSFSLGFIWSQARWRWGIIMALVILAFTLFYIILDLTDGHFLSIIYYVRMFFTNLLYIAVACLFSYIGSRLSDKIFNRTTA